MGEEKKLIITPAAWTPKHGALLDAAMRAEPMATAETLRADVEAGRATLLEVRDESGRFVGAVVLRVESRELGAEGVIDAAVGNLPGVALLPAVLPALEQSFYGVRSIRVQTARPGLIRALLPFGYRLREFTLAKVLH